MGNKDSTKIKQEISNKINTEIVNITSNINKVLNDTSTSTVSNIVNENVSQIKQSTAASANMKIGDINISGDSDILFFPRADRLFAECVRDGVLISEVKGSKAASQLALIKRLHS